MDTLRYGFTCDLTLTGHGGGDVVVLCTKASKIEVVGDQNITRSC